MWNSSELRRGLKVSLGLAAVQALALALNAFLAVALQGSWDRGALASVTAPSALALALARAAPAPTLPPSELDELRSDAAIGNLVASRELVTQLLDRFDRAGDKGDLLEAVQWMDREWGAGAYQRSGQATRVFEHYCDNPVLRWHWICDAGE